MGTEAVDADRFDAFEAAGWEDRVGGYQRFFVPITGRVVEPLLDLARVGPGSRVLDVASGPGHVAAACAARGATVVGLDVAHEMVALARALHPAVEFRQGDAQRLDFGDRSLDAVVGNFAILHFGRPERAVADFARVLAPGGALALSTWDVPERSRLTGLLGDAIREAGAAPPAHIPVGPPFYRFADEAEFARLLAGAGLGDVETRTVGFTHHFGTPEDLWRLLLDATVRSRVLVLDQPAPVQRRIRAEFDRLVTDYGTGAGLDIPVSVRLAAGVRAPDAGTPDRS